jgi:DNA invertase Pin-like site-specific DNA recombinase
MASELLNAVIYARYSSHSQTEQSIEGQLHDGYAYAERSGYHVVGEYIDRALTGTKDDRPDFQRMIKDAEKRQFQIVIVWKLDRFARNRYDSAIYKRLLKRFGVRVVSVMENITDSPEGIILEGLLESMAEYYSANLSENIRRGQSASVAKGWYCGGSVPLGYRIQDHKLVPDEKTAPLIRELYQRYADGESLAAIAADFNRRGFRTSRGREFQTGTFDRILPNPAYIGEYRYAGQTVPDLAAPLISKELYDRAVQRRDQNRRAPGSFKTPVDFILQGKLFCGLCGSPMCGDSGTSKSGVRHHYYACSARKHRKNDCKKKAEKKDFIEWYICEQTVQYVLSPDRLEHIASAVTELYNSEIDDTRLKETERLVQRLNDELNQLVDRLIYAPKEAAPRIGERMKQLELQRIDAETTLSKLRIQQKIKLSEKEVSAWLRTFSSGDLFDMDFRHKIIDTFINSVYLYDDKVVIFYNIKEGRQTCGIEQISALDEKIEAGDPCSDLPGHGGALLPKSEHAFIFVHGMLGLVLFR